MCKVTIIDSMCGTGKTSYAINKMINTNNKDINYIYITPYLDEVKRIKSSVTNRKFYEPTNRNKQGSKLQGFKDLIIKDRDIASTHALFTSVDNETHELLNSSNYTLILDEVMNVIDTKKITLSDFNILLEQQLITIDDNTNKISWKKTEYEGKYNDIKLLAENDNLYLHTRNRVDDKIILLVWTFPINIFKSFKEIYILTYLFKGQLQRAYYDMFNIKYTYKSVRYIDNEFKLIDYIDYNHEDKDSLKELINIYDGKLNNIGDKKFSLSSSWLKNPKNEEYLNKLKNNTYNYFRNIVNSKAKFNMWTTILGQTKDDKSVAKAIKLNGTVERHQKQLEKKAKTLTDQGIDLNNYNKMDHRQTATYWDICDYNSKLKDIKNNEEKIQEVNKTLETLREQLEKQEAKESENDNIIPEVLNTFLENWKQRAFKFYIDLANEYYIELLNKEYEITQEELEKIETTEYNWKSGQSTTIRKYSDEKIQEILSVNYPKYNKSSIKSEIQDRHIKQFRSSHFASDIAVIEKIRDYDTINETVLNKILDDDIKVKKENFISRIKEVIGEIKDLSRLSIVGGELNGIAIGSKCNAKVDTISAGGYAVQCAHYRVLVNVAK